MQYVNMEFRDYITHYDEIYIIVALFFGIWILRKRDASKILNETWSSN